MKCHKPMQKVCCLNKTLQKNGNRKDGPGNIEIFFGLKYSLIQKWSSKRSKMHFIRWSFSWIFLRDG